MLAGNRLSHSTIMFRRSAVQSIGGYRSEWFPVEDYDLWLRLCSAGRFAASEDSEVTCIVNPDGISGTLEATQMTLHVDRSYAEIARLAGRPVSATSNGRTLARAPAG